MLEPFHGLFHDLLADLIYFFVALVHGAAAGVTEIEGQHPGGLAVVIQEGRPVARNVFPVLLLSVENGVQGIGKEHRGVHGVAGSGPAKAVVITNQGIGDERLEFIVDFLAHFLAAGILNYLGEHLFFIVRLLCGGEGEETDGDQVKALFAPVALLKQLQVFLV